MLVFIMLYLFKPILPVASYIIQYDYIVNELCVNRDTPDLECNGKCHLKKELAEASSENQEHGKNYKFPVFEQVIFCEALESFPILKISSPFKKQQIISVESLYAFNFLNYIFQPPTI